MRNTMAQTITFEINGWSYDIFVEDDFATYLEEKISKDFNMAIPDSRKAIIHAYIKSTYELFKQEQEINDITKTISDAYSTKL